MERLQERVNSLIDSLENIERENDELRREKERLEGELSKMKEECEVWKKSAFAANALNKQRQQPSRPRKFLYQVHRSYFARLAGEVCRLPRWSDISSCFQHRNVNVDIALNGPSDPKEKVEWFLIMLSQNQEVTVRDLSNALAKIDYFHEKERGRFETETEIISL